VYHPTFQGCQEGSLRYACVETSMGRLLVVMSDRGVVDVILGDSLEQMLSSALKRFPDAGLFPDRGHHSEWVAAVVKRVEALDGGYAIPATAYDDRCRAAG